MLVYVCKFVSVRSCTSIVPQKGGNSIGNYASIRRSAVMVQLNRERASALIAALVALVGVTKVFFVVMEVMVALMGSACDGHDSMS